MDWSEERYARVYTRDTADLLAFGWEGRLVWYELLRKVDRAGVLDHGGDIDVVAELLRVPHDVFKLGLERIVKRGSARVTDAAIVIPNYLDAQEAEQSDRQRQRESRARRREVALAKGADPAAARAAARPDRYGGRMVTERDPMGSQNVPPGSHGSRDGSHGVTAGHSVPCRAVLNRAVPDQERDPAPEAPGVSAEFLAEGTRTGTAPAPTRQRRKRRDGLAGATPDEAAAVTAVLERLSDRTGRRYSPSVEGHAMPVLMALRRGFTEDDLRTVVWERANKWGGDPKMDEFLRPSTLFGKQKLPEYLAHAKAEWEASERDQLTARKRPEAPSKLITSLFGGRS